MTVARSDDEVVAKVEDGVVTALAAGEATITTSVGESKGDLQGDGGFTLRRRSATITIPTVRGATADWTRPDGLNPVWADAKATPLPVKTVIGIVSPDGRNRIAAGDKGGYTHADMS